MNRSIEEINKIVDIVMTDDDVMDALNTRILQKNLEQLKQAKAFKDGEESRKRDWKRNWKGNWRKGKENTNCKKNDKKRNDR